MGRFVLGASTLLLLLAGLVFALNFGYSRHLSGQEDNARRLTTELQVLSQQLPRFAERAVQGSEEDFDAFASGKRRVDILLDMLRRGSPSPNVRAYENNLLEVGTGAALGEVVDTWKRMSADADRLIAGREHVLALTDTAMDFNVRVPQLSAQLAEVVRGMSEGGATPSQINLANRQMVLADRMSRRVTEILAGGETAVTSADALQRDAEVFGRVLQGFREGDAEAGITQVTHPSAAQALDKVATLYSDARKELDEILQASTDLAEVQQSAQSFSADSDVLLEQAMMLHDSFGSSLSRVFPNDLLGIVAGIIAALALLGVLVSAWGIAAGARR